MNKAIDAAKVAANEKCELFSQIEEQIIVSKILSSDNILVIS